MGAKLLTNLNVVVVCSKSSTAYSGAAPGKAFDRFFRKIWGLKLGVLK